jgi:hypothetical protein
MINWIKKGLIYKPDGKFEWSQSHAQVPVVDKMSEEKWRIFFSTRDAQNRSNASFIDVNPENPKEILYENNSLMLPLGAIGTFDDCGVMPSWVIENDGLKYMYYIGWNVRNTIAYHNAIGLAISEDGGETYKKFSEGPLFDRNYIEPHYSGTSCILIENGVWKNWYLSCVKWEMVMGKSEPFYHIKYAESKDGINWDRKGTVAIDYKTDKEAGIVKASVIKEGDLYKMWYSYRNIENYRIDRSQSYRIGYAESANGVDWVRMDDKNNLDVSETGWDSEMVEYPHVISHKNKLLMFYNGNGFGASGFGYAESEN